MNQDRMDMLPLLTPRWAEPKRRYHKQQHEIRVATTRGRVMDCGRRSGKTLLACEIAVSRLLDVIPNCPLPRYCFGAPVQEQANEISGNCCWASRMRKG